MEGARSAMINGGNLSQRITARLIPKRGQVKMAIVGILLHSVSSMFSHRCGGADAHHFS
ncbi:hypothetical protein RchiOBHm_Chr5g0006771 [Rosa chinensis]|uniref:Uncharacterized protein n=1 Tax=Rosa chinensis TaxID=74649 RepID=A0A2P6Q3M9_ROSCH|nr:hypothetical protein RchiOBHm_Chr5g0006771 [Rosa chinensis]